MFAVSDGRLATSIDRVLEFPRDKAQALTKADPEGWLTIPVNSFVFRRGGQTVLVDAGSADYQPTLGWLASNLMAAGVPPASVTHILMTHLHPDHANGLISADGSAVYPNAEIVIAAQEHDFWMADEQPGDSEPVRKFRRRNRMNLAPYQDRIRLVRDGNAVLGCTAILAPGHSPGHTCWLVETGGEGLLAWGDVVQFPGVQLSHPDIALNYDMDSVLSTRSRLHMLDMAVNGDLTVAGAHMEEGGVGRIIRRGGAYAFLPHPPAPDGA